MDIGIPFLPHAYPVEVLQFLAALVGTIASFWGTIDAWKDLEFLYRYGVDSYRLVVGKRNFFEEWMRLALHLLFLASGIFSLFAPPPSTVEYINPDNLAQLWVSRMVMAVASIILMIKSIRDNNDRKRLRNLLGSAEPDLLRTIKSKASDIVSAIEQKELHAEGAD